MSVIKSYSSNYSIPEIKTIIRATTKERCFFPNVNHNNRIFYKMRGPYLSFFVYPGTSDIRYYTQFYGIIKPTETGSKIIGVYFLSAIHLFLYLLFTVIAFCIIKIPVLSSASLISLIMFALLFVSIGPKSEHKQYLNDYIETKLLCSPQKQNSVRFNGDGSS